MKRFIIALQFLTILPAKTSYQVNENDSACSLIYFPVVGTVLGILLALILILFGFLPQIVSVCIVLIASIILTGALHLDGFADTCDGFYSSKKKEEILNIMRDSRVGTMGAIGITCILLFKFTILFCIPNNLLWKTLIMMTSFSRCGQVWACSFSKYARADGKGRNFIGSFNKKTVIISTFYTLALFILLMKLNGFVIFLISTIPIYLFIVFVKTKIGGMTGDTVGATNEFAEITILFLTLLIYSFK